MTRTRLAVIPRSGLIAFSLEDFFVEPNPLNYMFLIKIAYKKQ